MATPADPLFSQQWHFPLIGDIQTIWDEYTGVGVNVGVYDSGVEWTHPDLAGNYDASLHFFFDDPTTASTDQVEHAALPLPEDEDEDQNPGHGTSVAGLIGAVEGNDLGGVGVAYGSTLTAVNVFDFSSKIEIAFDDGDFVLAAAWSQIFYDSLAYAQTFDIMSNSWGFGGNYRGYQNIADPTSAAAIQAANFLTAAENGRGGLGTVILQSAGNGGVNGSHDGINALRYNIVVAATDSNGDAEDYTNFGTSILITAPASAVTTDLTGSDGYNNDSDNDLLDDDFTSTFNGTSAATPTVSGVVALMLEANENLGWRDVQNILAVTASLTGENLDGSNASSFEIGDWFTQGYDGAGFSWNGGGNTFHASYGFGMVNVFAAVRMAESWLVMFEEAQTSANEQHVTVTYGGPNVAISTDLTNPSVITQTVTEDLFIEHVNVTVSITHSWLPDVRLYLIGPDGEEIPLFLNEGTTELADFGWTWTFGITALLGFSSLGNWSLVAVDSWASEDDGVITDFTIDFYGQANTNNSVHFVTNDFLNVAAFDPSREVIADGDGGTDWLNFVSVNPDGDNNGNVVLNLASGSEFFVDGNSWGFLEVGGDVFENAMMGDGNDTVVGNTLNNEIHGMRGNDVLVATGGTDQIFGGVGDDILVVEGPTTPIDPNTIGLLTGGDGTDVFYFYTGASGKVLDYQAGDIVVLQDTLATSAFEVVSPTTVKAGDVEIIAQSWASNLQVVSTSLSDYDWPDGVPSVASTQDLLDNVQLYGATLTITNIDVTGTTSYLVEQMEYVSGFLWRARIEYDDNTSKLTTFDSVDAAAWDQIVNLYTTGGGLHSQRILNDDATSKLTTFDLSGNSWDQIVNLYTTGEDLHSQRILNDDATSKLTTFDLSGNNWDQIVNLYTSTGGLRTQTIFNDDNSRKLTTFDLTGTAWDQIVNIYTTTGGLDTQNIFYDDNTRKLTTFDLASTTWDQIVNIYTAAGGLDTQNIFYDDGTRKLTTFDLASNTWDQIVNLYNDAGALRSQTIFYDDNTSKLTQYDLGSNVWDTVININDDSGDLSFQRITYDDGTKREFTYDLAGAFAWDYVIRDFDAAGNMISESFEFI